MTPEQIKQAAIAELNRRQAQAELHERQAKRTQPVVTSSLDLRAASDEIKRLQQIPRTPEQQARLVALLQNQNQLDDEFINAQIYGGLPKLKRTVARDHLEAFTMGGERGISSTVGGIKQRGAQALNAVGIDLEDFLSELAASQQAEREAFRPTEEKYPITSTVGKVAGEVAAMPLPATKLPSLIATGAVIGGAQYGEEGTLSEFAVNAGMGAASSVVGDQIGKGIASLTQKAAQRLGKHIPDNLFNPNGTLKPEAQAYFDEEGINKEFLSKQIINEVNSLPDGSDLKQAMRKAEARDLGVTELTKGDISQSFDDQAAEFALSRQSGTNEANMLRDVKARQNEQLTSAGENIAQSMGDPNKLNVGTAIQEGLRGTRDQRREAVRELYRIAAEREGVTILVEQKGIAEAFAEQDFLFGLDPDIGGQLRAVQKQLEAFSVLNPDVLTDTSRIQSLNIGTAEQLRKNINALINETSPKSFRALKPIINAIDEAVDTLTITDDMGEEAANAFKEARAAAQQFALDFQAKDIIQDIVSTKPGTQTDKIPASVVYDKIMGTRSRLEATQAIKEALLKGGNQDTWNDFKATAALELIGKGLTTGKTATGQMRFSGANFNKALKKIGNPTLETIFGPQELARLRQLGRVSRDLTILQDGVFTPSGAHAENALFKLSRMLLFRVSPIGRMALEEGGEVMKRSAQRNTLKQVLNPNVDVAKQLGGYSNAAINALRLMAISGQSQLRDKEDKK